jgi:Pyridoxamine 5'-phosphate oxidase
MTRVSILARRRHRKANDPGLAAASGLWLASVRVAVVLTGAWLCATAAGASVLSAEMQNALHTQKEIYVATRRADGSRSNAAPVWFWSDGRAVYFSTSPKSHKARRIRSGSPVFFSLAGRDGPFTEGRPEIVTDLDLVGRLGDAYANKYWIAWFGLFRPNPARVASGKTMVVKVTWP